MKTPDITTRDNAPGRGRSRRAILKAVPPPERGDAPAGPLWTRLAWFVGLCLAGSVSVATVAYILRALPFGA